MIKALQQIKKKEGDLQCKVETEHYTFKAAVSVKRPDEYSEKIVVLKIDW